MKKYLFALSMAAVIVAACAKESQNDEFAPASSEGIVYTLSVKAPLTKASLDENTGAFQWSANDQIAVFDNEQNKYQIFTTASPGSNATFTFVATDGLSHDFTGSKAYYPVSRLNSAQTEISTPIEISSAAEVPMAANNDNGSLVFDYEAAVVKLTIENVPSFSMSVEFQNSGNSYAAEVSHSINENMTFYFVVGESTSRASSIILYDSDNNEIIHKDFDLNGDITKGALIPLKTKVGPVIVFKNYATSWTGFDIYCYEGNSAYDGEWNSTAAKVKKYVKDNYDYYYRVLPTEAYNKDLSVILHNTSGDRRIVLYSMAINSYELHYSASQKEGIRKENDGNARMIVWDQVRWNAYGTSDPIPVYAYAWNGSNKYLGDYPGSKALGYFETTRNSSTSTRYWYFDINSLGSVFDLIITGREGNTEQYKLEKDNMKGLAKANYLHFGYDNSQNFFIDSDFDAQVTE